jgi:hypothetical protein
VKAAQNNQKLMLALVVGGYGLSIVDGLFFGSSSSKKSGRRSAETLLPDGNGFADSGRNADMATDEVEEAPRLWDMKLHLLPKQDPGVMLSINRSF